MALQQLLADIQAHKVDTVVVYKVDRLTRSLADLAKIVEVFDAHEVSHRMAAMGTECPWRWGRGTISANLDVIWGMSVKRFEMRGSGNGYR